MTWTEIKTMSRKHTGQLSPPSTCCGQLWTNSRVIGAGRLSSEEVCFGLDSFCTRWTTRKVFDELISTANECKGKNMVTTLSSRIYVTWRGPMNENCTFGGFFFGFMKAIEQCNTWNAIWIIEVEGVGLINYALAFAPFFCIQFNHYFWAAWEAQCL